MLVRTRIISSWVSSMSLLKQAKTLSKRQIALTTALLQQTRYPARNLAIFLLSVKAGTTSQGDRVAHLGHGH